MAYVFTTYSYPVYTCGISCSMTGAPSHSSHALNPSFYDKAHASSKDHGLDVDFDMLQFCALKARATSLSVGNFPQKRQAGGFMLGFCSCVIHVWLNVKVLWRKSWFVNSNLRWNPSIIWLGISLLVFIKRSIPQILHFTALALHMDWAETACNNMQRDVTALGPWQPQHLLLAL